MPIRIEIDIMETKDGMLIQYHRPPGNGTHAEILVSAAIKEHMGQFKLSGATVEKVLDIDPGKADEAGRNN